MLLDERLSEDHGDAIIRVLLVFLALAVGLPNLSQAQTAEDAQRRIASFKNEWPDLYARVMAMERAHGVLYGALLRDRGKVKESDLYGMLTRRVNAGAPLASADPEADVGYALLGTRAAEVIRRTQAFHREVLAIFAGVGASDRARALDEAVERYLSRPEVSLPDVPKDTDHPLRSPYIFRDRRGRPSQEACPEVERLALGHTGFSWRRSRPLEVATNADERRQGLTIVADQIRPEAVGREAAGRLSHRAAARSCIAPGLVAIHLRAAAILDNLSMLHAVLADVLVHPKVGNVRAALDEAVAQFTSRTYRVVDVDDWIQMALRHSIFAQGGPALGTMTQSERNNNGHRQHATGGRATMRGMP